jgi:hypothetical protein
VSHAKGCLLEVTRIQADRGPNNEKNRSSAMALRNWYCERERILPVGSTKLGLKAGQVIIPSVKLQKNAIQSQSSAGLLLYCTYAFSGWSVFHI